MRMAVCGLSRTKPPVAAGRRLLQIVGVLAFVAAWLQAQAVNRVSGLITDQSGAVIVGATVTAQSVATNVVTTVQSNDSGYYALQLPVGHITSRLRVPGFDRL